MASRDKIWWHLPKAPRGQQLPRLIKPHLVLGDNQNIIFNFLFVFLKSAFQFKIMTNKCDSEPYWTEI